MAADAVVQVRVDHDIKERAAMVLQDMGLTIFDAVRILLTRTANEGSLPFALAQGVAAYDALFHAKVQAALDGPRPGLPHAEVEAHFAARRAGAVRKLPRMMCEAGIVLTRTQCP